MKVKARFFALFREVVGKGLDEVEIEGPITVGAFQERIAQRYPKLTDYFAHVTVAVNAEYAARDQKLKDGDEVAFFPPLSGG